MSNLLTIPCAIESVSTRRDKTIKITVGTQELTPAQVSELLNQWAGGIGVMAFKGEQFNYNDEALLNNLKIDAEELGSKTPSQRLRAVLYILFQNSPDGHKDFSTYYAAMIERFIDMIKKRIDTFQLW